MSESKRGRQAGVKVETIAMKLEKGEAIKLSNKPTSTECMTAYDNLTKILDSVGPTLEAKKKALEADIKKFNMLNEKRSEIFKAASKAS